MAAIDWFFKWSPTSESMHQVVLSGLFGHTQLLNLLGIQGVPTDVQVETKGGLYDFTVRLSTGANLNIELKVDCPLHETQIRRQIDGLREADLLLYILLGITRFQWRQWQLERTFRKFGRPAAEKSLLRVDLEQMLQGINSLAAESIDDTDQRDMAVAYGSLLRKLCSITACFGSKDLTEWDWADWHGFYANLNDRLNLQDGGQDTVNPPSGAKFLGYWWHWWDLPLSKDAEAYLQLEQDKLCFKVSVPETSDRGRVRNQFSETVLKAAMATELAVEKPPKFGTGNFMTSAKLTGDYRCKGGKRLDWEFCERTVRTAMTILEAAVRTCSP